MKTVNANETKHLNLAKTKTKESLNVLNVLQIINQEMMISNVT